MLLIVRCSGKSVRWKNFIWKLIFIYFLFGTENTLSGVGGSSYTVRGVSCKQTANQAHDIQTFISSDHIAVRLDVHQRGA